MTPLRALPRLCSCILLTFLVLAGTAMPAAAAEDLLVVSNASDPGQAEVGFSEAELLALPQVTIRTRTEFTDGVVEFVGPLARDVIAFVEPGAAANVHLVAANDYAIDIPIGDFTKYDVILALSTNGKRLTIRDKGPIWLMYPLDDHTELQDPMFNNRLIWQLTVIELQ